MTSDLQGQLLNVANHHFKQSTDGANGKREEQAPEEIDSSRIPFDGGQGTLVPGHLGWKGL